MALTAAIKFCWKFICVCIYVYIYIYMCVCVCVCVCVCAEIFFTAANISFNGSVFSSCIYETCYRREKL